MIGIYLLVGILSIVIWAKVRSIACIMSWSVLVLLLLLLEFDIFTETVYISYTVIITIILIIVGVAKYK